MKKDAIRKRILIGLFLWFGGLTVLVAVVLYLDPRLMHSWIGPSLLAAPPVIGVVFYIIVRLSLKELEGPVVSKEIPKEKGPIRPVEEASVPEVEPLSPSYYQEIAIVQILGLLQREGRLLDFLQEDIEPYDDAQIGAAVREVHRGCRAAMKEVFGLAPVLDAAEGSQVEIEEDFDPTRIKLIGNVHGKPPFKGTLRHCGWRFTEVHLPKWTSKETTDVLAPAEVEIS